jgi:hypothetical protein
VLDFCDGLKTELQWASRAPADEALDHGHRRTNFGDRARLVWRRPRFSILEAPWRLLAASLLLLNPSPKRQRLSLILAEESTQCLLAS